MPAGTIEPVGPLRCLLTDRQPATDGIFSLAPYGVAWLTGGSR